MIRLHITAEGQTEQRFVHEVLQLHLAAFEVYADVRCVITGKDKRAGKGHRGGMTTYVRARDDILAWMKEDSAPECRFTTMFDLYRLPRDFPGYEEAMKKTDLYQRVSDLEQALAKDTDDRHLVPYIQLHEFETLILSDPQKLDWEYLEHEEPIKRLIAMVEREGNPELINGGDETAPSKRIIKEIPEHEGNKISGASVAARIGLPILREKCRHFHEWVSRLERLGAMP